MKSKLFSNAIINRNRVKFLYGLNEVMVEPYYVCRNKTGKKVLYGKINGSNEVKSFEYEKMANIKIMAFEKFSPIIPIMPIYN